MGGPQCRMSISRSGYVPGRYFCNFDVDFKITQCRTSNSRNTLYVMPVASFFMSIGFMSPANFKKQTYRPVGFKGQGPQV